MKRIHSPALSIVSLLLLSALFLPGCIRQRVLTPLTTLGNVICPPPPEREIQVFGPVSAEASGGTVLFLFSYGDPVWETSGEGPAGKPVPVDDYVMTAVFKALEQTPEANAVLDARIVERTVNFLFWNSWSVKVRGRAAKVPPPLQDVR